MILNVRICRWERNKMFEWWQYFVSMFTNLKHSLSSVHLCSRAFMGVNMNARTANSILIYAIICTPARVHICTSCALILPKCGQPQPFLNIPQDEKLINAIAPANMNLPFFIANCSNCYHYTKNPHTGSKGICKHVAPVGTAPCKNGELKYLYQPTKNNSKYSN